MKWAIKDIGYKMMEAKSMVKEKLYSVLLDKFQFIEKLESMTIKILSPIISNCSIYSNELNLLGIYGLNNMKVEELKMHRQ